VAHTLPIGIGIAFVFGIEIAQHFSGTSDPTATT
jgi:hypothetical protein